METSFRDDTRRPVLLFGEFSSNIGASGGLYPKKWQEATMGQNLHAVLEGFEPATGIRLDSNRIKYYKKQIGIE